jgi:hypothetical protein
MEWSGRLAFLLRAEAVGISERKLRDVLNRKPHVRRGERLKVAR